MGRIVVILTALLVADAYFWHGEHARVAMQTAENFGGNFNDQIARHLQPPHH